MSDSKIINSLQWLGEVSKFNHLVLFKQPPYFAGDTILHLPTDNYKYDLYVRAYDDDLVEVQLYRYFQSYWGSELQDNFLLSSINYAQNIAIINDELNEKPVNIRTNCVWLEQSKVRMIFDRLKRFKVGQSEDASQQIEMFEGV